MNLNNNIINNNNNNNNNENLIDSTINGDSYANDTRTQWFNINNNRVIEVQAKVKYFKVGDTVSNGKNLNGSGNGYVNGYVK